MAARANKAFFLDMFLISIQLGGVAKDATSGAARTFWHYRDRSSSKTRRRPHLQPRTQFNRSEAELYNARSPQPRLKNSAISAPQKSPRTNLQPPFHMQNSRSHVRMRLCLLGQQLTKWILDRNSSKSVPLSNRRESMQTASKIKVLFVAGFGPIVRETAESRKLYGEVLGIRFKEEKGSYSCRRLWKEQRLSPCGLFPRRRSCFGSESWPGRRSCPTSLGWNSMLTT